MKLIRFMGEQELRNYLRGSVLENFTEWNQEHNRSGSIGFCFFDDQEAPESRMHYLSGIVDMHFCVELMPIGPQHFWKSLGAYARPGTSVAEAMFKESSRQWITEYSTTHYSRDTMALVRVGIPDMHNYFDYQIRWMTDEELVKFMNERDKDADHIECG